MTRRTPSSTVHARSRHALTAAVVAGSLALGACSFDIDLGDGIDGSGTLTTERHDVAEFDTINVGDGLDVQLEFIAGDDGLEITVDDNLHDELRLVVEGDTLELSTRGNTTIDPTDAVVVRISGHTLSGVEAEEASSVTGNIPSIDTLRIDAQEASDVDLVIDTDRADISASEASDIDLSGRADTATVTAHEASNVRMTATDVENATVSAHEASDIEIDASGRVTGEAEEASSIEIWGTTDVDVDASEASDVSINN